MQHALFGKLPAKRDFVGVRTPRAFLGVWEPWLQAAISSSRNTLSDRWQPAFLKAPIWRFWLGSSLCGVSTLGAWMPSVDAVGRYFPLALAAIADPGEEFPAPALEPQERWFEAAESVLLDALQADRTLEATIAALDRLPPLDRPAIPLAEDVIETRPETFVTRAADRGFRAAFGRLGAIPAATLHRGSSFWWTEGGEDFERLCLICPGMPDPFIMATMLTGEADP